MAVVFPAPFGPTRAKTTPGGTSSVRPGEREDVAVASSWRRRRRRRERRRASPHRTGATRAGTIPLSMKDVYRRAVFALAGAEYTWGDVALAAALRGDWRAVAERARLGARLLAREDGPDGTALPDDEVEDAANAFRYARDLVTAEETEAWLDRWDLDPESWMTWIASDLLRQRGVDGPDTLEPLPEASESAVHAEAVCSGALERFAVRLAEAAAVAARLDEEAGPGSPENGTPEIEELAPAVSDLAGLPFEPPPEGFGPRLLELARLERARRRWRESPVSPEDVEAIVRLHQTDWLRVRALVLSLRSEDAAREALLSIRHDGRALEEVARDASASLRAEAFTLESVEESLRDHLLAARKGEWAGPFPCGDSWNLFHVEEKVLPSSSDPEIAARAEASLRASAAAREIDVRVSWRWTK